LAISREPTANSQQLWYNYFIIPAMNDQLLNRSVKVLLLFFLIGFILYYGRPFLVPLTFAMLLSMLLLPLSTKLEGWGLGRGMAIVLSILVLVLFFAGVVALLAWQVSDISSNSSEIEKNITQKVQQVRQFVTQSLGISPQKQQEVLQKQQQSSGNQLSSMISGAFAGFGTFITNALIVLVYIFLFMFFRGRLKNFILKLVPDDQRTKTTKVMEESRKVAQKYITGLAYMIVGLWIMYSIGFSIVGVKNAIFFAILCGLLEIVPFVGNLLGNALTVIMTLAQGGDLSMVIGILVVYGLVQFIQSYILEPLVVGSEVSINPVFTIVGIIAGEFVWGIPGMILAIPVMGIMKIVFDNVEPLKPYGYLMGQDKKDQTNWTDKIKGWFGKGKKGKD
jgi:predicted PurR-regulated permease PerM